MHQAQWLNRAGYERVASDDVDRDLPEKDLIFFDDDEVKTNEPAKTSSCRWGSGCEKMAAGRSISCIALHALVPLLLLAAGTGVILTFSPSTRSYLNGRVGPLLTNTVVASPGAIHPGANAQVGSGDRLPNTRWSPKQQMAWYDSQPEDPTAAAAPAPKRARWTPERAAEWYEAQPWLVGSNYVPTYASNQLEMFQPDTFNLSRIDEETSWAQEMGFTTNRVFLHNLLYEEDSEGFLGRLDKVVGVMAARGIRPLLVFFDSCWDPYPQPGPQREPAPGVHNSRWLQSPGAEVLVTIDKEERASAASGADVISSTLKDKLKTYVQAVASRFGDDGRVLDVNGHCHRQVWNEPDNGVGDRLAIIERILPEAFEWIREVNVTQPLTSGLWYGIEREEWGYTKLMQIQAAYSDVISFHSYGRPRDWESWAEILQGRFGRPVICTEWLARSVGSTVRGVLPVGKHLNVGMINWGFGFGRSQTIYPWDSWQHPYKEEPNPWFHDLMRPDGSPYSEDEHKFYKTLLLEGK
ncbi:hypothetical protein HK101_011853 [Irineochytrium annulatum]|nr:hypothetical protein HK101_011853 [Irineochytrium annulatum]